MILILARFLQLRFHAALPLALCLCFAWPVGAQQPEPPAKSSPSPNVAAEGSSVKHRKTLPPFLIIGTVFNEKALAFPGVSVKIRRKGEKKFRFETYTNSRGEFAVRVPDGIEYEVVVRQKNYKHQSELVVAKSEDVQKRLTFRLETATPGKAGQQQ